MSADVVKAQMLDTRPKVVVVSFDALGTFLAADKELPKDAKLKNILVIDRDPWSKLPEECSSFRALYNDDGSMCPKTLPGEQHLLTNLRTNSV